MQIRSRSVAHLAGVARQVTDDHGEIFVVGKQVMMPWSRVGDEVTLVKVKQCFLRKKIT